MTQLRLQISALVFLLMVNKLEGQNNYPLHIQGIDRDSTFIISNLGLKTAFDTRYDCVAYINQLPQYLQEKGYVTASLDSILYDSAFAKVVLYMGDRYEWAQLDASQINPSVLQAIGWRDKVFVNKPMDFLQVKQWRKRF